MAARRRTDSRFNAKLNHARLGRLRPGRSSAGAPVKLCILVLKGTYGYPTPSLRLHSHHGLDQASRVQPATWPPYNIERLGDDQYRIVMALAGFAPDEIELVQKENALFVAGQKHADPDGVEVLHRGIATRAFKQTFNLADHMKVTGATLEHGLLIVDLKREVPEAPKPRRIDIASQEGRAALPQDNQRETIGQTVNVA